MLPVLLPTTIDGPQASEPGRANIVRHLRELIIALDRRVPRLERKDEPVIARDAALLRDEALQRIEELDRS